MSNQREIFNIVTNEAILNPVKSGTKEYNDLMVRISSELKKNKSVITVINGELCEIYRRNDRTIIEKMRPKLKA
jgi:hypothetical protein